MRRLSFLFLLVLVVASLLRFPFVDLYRFEHEMIRDITLAESISHQPIYHGILGKLSPTATQQSFGPVYYYLIWFSLLFSPSAYLYPLMPYLLVIILHLLTLLFTFLFCKRFFSERVALFTASLFTLSPWVVLHFSVVFTNPNFLPFFVMLAFYTYYKILYEHQHAYLFVFFAAIALQLQFHLSSLLLLPVYGSLFFFKPILFRNKQFYLASLFGSLFFLPFFISFVTSADTSVFSFIGNRYASSYTTNIIEGFGIPTLFVTSYLSSYLLGNTSIDSFFPFPSLFWIMVVLLASLFICSTFFVLYLFFKNPTLKNRYLPLLLWFFIPILLAIAAKKNISPHYLIILLPVPFIFLGIFFNFLYEKRKTLVLSFFLSFLVFNIFFISSFYIFLSEHGTQGIFGIPYSHKVELVQTLSSQDTLIINYYSTEDRTLTYLFHHFGFSPTFHTLLSLEEFHEGYLVLDTFSFYSPLKQGLSAEQQSFLAYYPSLTYKHYRIYSSDLKRYPLFVIEQ